MPTSRPAPITASGIAKYAVQSRPVAHCTSATSPTEITARLKVIPPSADLSLGFLGLGGTGGSGAVGWPLAKGPCVCAYGSWYVGGAALTGGNGAVSPVLATAEVSIRAVT